MPLLATGLAWDVVCEAILLTLALAIFVTKTRKFALGDDADDEDYDDDA